MSNICERPAMRDNSKAELASVKTVNAELQLQMNGKNSFGIFEIKL